VIRSVLAACAALALASALNLSAADTAGAQMPPATPPPVPAPLTPDSALEGMLSAVAATHATLQTPEGQSLRLVFAPRGYLLVDPSPQALSAGMRVFALGFPRSDGSIAVDEIDVLVPLNLMQVTPAPAKT
jgi:hypothetical protein